MDFEHPTNALQRIKDALFAATNLEHKRLATERELQSLKWLGYRFMTPLAATKLFYDTYREHRYRYVKEHKDKELAESLRVVTFEDYVKEPKALALAWSSRQRADVLGVPYGSYIEFSMWFWSRRGNGGRRWTPQINQLHYTDNSEVAWLVEFGKHVADRSWLNLLQLRKVPQLHKMVFEGTSEQRAARSFIADQCAKSTRSWSDLISMWCYTYPLLDIECFKPLMSADVFHAAVEIVEATPMDPSVSPPLTEPGFLLPSCHGMIGALDASEPICMNCKFAASCGKLASLVKETLRRTTGHEEPRKAQLRKAANDRMRRCREAKKAAGASGSLPAEATTSLPEVTLP